MSNFGFSHLRLVSPYEVAFREARSAVGAADVLRRATVHATVAEAVADCPLVVGTASQGHRERKHPLRRLESGARLLRKHLASAPAALLFGSEKFGLSNDDLTWCHWLLRIPTPGTYESMNLGQAVAVCLYELTRDGRAPSADPKSGRLAASGDLDRLTELLHELLRTSGWVQPRVAASTLAKTRRLVRRLGLSEHDAEIWLGMLRQIRWKLDQPS